MNPRFFVLLAVLCGLGACRKSPEASQAPPAASSAAPDRLAPGEALPESTLTFGIEVPRGMKVTSRFPDVVQLRGPLSVEQLVAYYQKHVVVPSVELTPTEAVFSPAYVKGDPKKRVYRIAISKKPKGSLVRFSDITGAKPIQGLSQAERWERVGRGPDGSQKDKLKAY